MSSSFSTRPRKRNRVGGLTCFDLSVPPSRVHTHTKQKKKKKEVWLEIDLESLSYSIYALPRNFHFFFSFLTKGIAP